jgi:hypothetical protein
MFRQLASILFLIDALAIGLGVRPWIGSSARPCGD